MSEDEKSKINAVIAEICGTVNSVRHYDGSHGGGHWLGNPNYCDDLNAMHEAESIISQKFGHLSVLNASRDYWVRLMSSMNPGVKLWDNGTFLGDWDNAIRVGEATSLQKAETLYAVIVRRNEILEKHKVKA